MYLQESEYVRFFSYSNFFRTVVIHQTFLLLLSTIQFPTLSQERKYFFEILGSNLIQNYMKMVSKPILVNFSNEKKENVGSQTGHTKIIFLKSIYC